VVDSGGGDGGGGVVLEVLARTATAAPRHNLAVMVALRVPMVAALAVLVALVDAVVLAATAAEVEAVNGTGCDRSSCMSEQRRRGSSRFFQRVP